MPNPGAVMLLVDVKSAAVTWSAPARPSTVAMCVALTGALTRCPPLIWRLPEFSTHEKEELDGHGAGRAEFTGWPSDSLGSVGRVKSSQKITDPPPFTCTVTCAWPAASPSLAVSVI